MIKSMQLRNATLASDERGQQPLHAVDPDRDTEL